MHKLTLSEFDVAASWKRHGSGVRYFEAKGHDKAGWVTIWVTEHADTGASKAATYTLVRAEAERLRDLLNDVLGSGKVVVPGVLARPDKYHSGEKGE
jgi:hypothetical protein